MAKKALGRPKGKPRTKAEIAADAMRTGRPYLSPYKEELKMVSLRFTASDFEIFRTDAENAGMGLAAFARHCWQLAKDINYGNDFQNAPKSSGPCNGKEGGGAGRRRKAGNAS